MRFSCVCFACLCSSSAIIHTPDTIEIICSSESTVLIGTCAERERDDWWWMFAEGFKFNAAHYFSLSTGISVEMAMPIIILPVRFADSFGIARFFYASAMAWPTALQIECKQTLGRTEKRALAQFDGRTSIVYTHSRRVLMAVMPFTCFAIITRIDKRNGNGTKSFMASNIHNVSIALVRQVPHWHITFRRIRFVRAVLFSHFPSADSISSW